MTALRKQSFDQFRWGQGNAGGRPSTTGNPSGGDDLEIAPTIPPSERRCLDRPADRVVSIDELIGSFRARLAGLVV